MIAGVAVLVAVIFGALALLHVAWAVGARPVSAAVIPCTPAGAPVINPGPAVTLVVAALLLLAANLLLDRVGLGLQLFPAGQITAAGERHDAATPRRVAGAPVRRSPPLRRHLHGWA
ncbi:MAG: hypothetical protein U0P30_09140 [Vicinamibacterales bacterium]